MTTSVSPEHKARLIVMALEAQALYREMKENRNVHPLKVENNLMLAAHWNEIESWQYDPRTSIALRQSWQDIRRARA